MAEEPAQQPEPSGRSGDPVQPVVPDQVPARWLLDPETLSLAETVDRLAGDVEVVTQLALGKYQGRDWEYFATELARYGIAVIEAWLHKGLIFQKCRSRGLGGLVPLDRPFERDEVEELAGETVAKALRHFRDDVLIPGKWDSRRGATLRTYFIGQCLIRFANIYRRWHGNESRARHARLTADTVLLVDSSGTSTDDPAATAVDRALIDQALATVKDPRVRQAIGLRAAGRTHGEIADHLGVSVKTVERMLANERSRQRKRWTA